MNVAAFLLPFCSPQKLKDVAFELKSIGRVKFQVFRVFALFRTKTCFSKFGVPEKEPPGAPKRHPSITLPIRPPKVPGRVRLHSQSASSSFCNPAQQSQSLIQGTDHTASAVYGAARIFEDFGPKKSPIWPEQLSAYLR